MVTDSIVHEVCENPGRFEHGQLITGGVVGASHREKNKPCQDASIAGIYSYKGHPYTLMAVADGHGSERHPRSELGAHFAIQATAEAAADWIVGAVESLEREPESWKNIVSNRFSTDFAEHLHQRWNVMVDAHMGKDVKFSRSAYGTTIAMALIFQGFIYAGAIGDSSVLIVKNSKEAGDILAGKDSSMLGLETNSLAQKDAANKWTAQVLPLDDVNLLCTVTDGFTDSLTSTPNTLIALAQDTRDKGLNWLRSKLPAFLERLTDQGVGDDIAVVFYFPPRKSTPETTRISDE